VPAAQQSGEGEGEGDAGFIVVLSGEAGCSIGGRTNSEAAAHRYIWIELNALFQTIVNSFMRWVVNGAGSIQNQTRKRDLACPAQGAV
jgi:hypothetical protein